MNNRKKTPLLALTTLLILFSALPAAVGRAAPLFATALLEGRTHDQAHDTGYIDWNGSVLYENFYHKDSTQLPPEEGSVICTAGCTENVTRINAGASVSGAFLRDVTYFEGMAAYEYQGAGVGSVTLNACGSSLTYYLGKNNNTTPGFNSFALPVPAGCRSWSISASGGHVHVRSVDVYYVAPTATPTITSTPTQTATGTLPPTHTPTTTTTATAPPTNTRSPSPTATGTTPPTATATATATLAPTQEPPGTPWIVTVPVVVVIQEQNIAASGGGSLTSYAMTPTPPAAPYYGYPDAGCHFALRAFVYVDENEDKLMSPNEGAQGLEVVVMDQSYARLGSRYTQEGQAVFCLSPSLYGRRLRVEIPYLHQAQDAQIPRNLDQDVEVWFRLQNPTLPLYLP